MESFQIMLTNLLKRLLYFLAYPILIKNNKFHNLHKGESCYIIGDGISLKYFDLKTFNDKIAFACNYIPFHNDFKKINAKYCVNAAPFFFSPFLAIKIISSKNIYIILQNCIKV